MIFEFKKPKLESQCITEMKEIKQALAEIVWDFDQRLKTLMAKVIFQMSNVQNKEWFISALLPHIQGPLMQQKIESQTKALELAMKIKASPIGGDMTGMVQIHSQLSNLMIQLQDIKKVKEAQEDLWCTKCRTDGQTKDNYPTFMNYVTLGAPTILNGRGYHGVVYPVKRPL